MRDKWVNDLMIKSKTAIAIKVLYAAAKWFKKHLYCWES